MSESTSEPGDEIECDSAVVECATGDLLQQLLPQLRITAKLAEFEMSRREAHEVCAALRGCNFLETPPCLLAEDLAERFLQASTSDGLNDRERKEVAARLHALSPPEAFLLFAGTALYWAVNTRYAQVEPKEFMRVTFHQRI
jgi:hypothetical protein